MDTIGVIKPNSRSYGLYLVLCIPFKKCPSCVSKKWDSLFLATICIVGFYPTHARSPSTIYTPLSQCKNGFIICVRGHP